MTVPIGTQGSPLLTPDCYDVALRVLQEGFREGGDPTLVVWRGNWYHYENLRWNWRSGDWMKQWLLRELGEAWVLEDPDDPGVSKRWRCNTHKVNEVMAFMEARRQVDCLMPGWISGAGPLDSEWVIAFQDALVSVEGGTASPIERTSDWLDSAIVPCNYTFPNVFTYNGPDLEPTARIDNQCPRWMQCLDEWSGGDEVWITLLQRWMGYCLLGHRKYARWLLMKGEPRSGKGTIAAIIRKLVGETAFISTSLYTMSTQYGLHGLEQARVLSVIEAADIQSKEGERASHVIKAMLGQDPVDVDRKYQSILRNTMLDVAIMMQSNQTVRLPNRGRGLSDKMLVLPFAVSFTGHEDVRLLERLEVELEGIAWWAVEGARQLAASEPGTWFPMPAAGEAEVREYMLENNPVDRFLEARFREVAGGFVSTDVLWREWRHWLSRNEVRTMWVERNRLTPMLVAESSWRITRSRTGAGTRGVRGLALLRERGDDEV